MGILVLIVLILPTIIFFDSVSCFSEEQPGFTYSKLYEAGKEAYKDERWYECAAFMRRSLEDYNFYQSVLWNCHQRCDRHIPTDPYPIDTPSFRQEKKLIFDRKGAVPDARIFEKFLKKALCLRRCKIDRLPGRPRDQSNSNVEKDFRELKPYSYMQLCFWKLSDLGHAVSAAYTFLTRNPSDTMMSENLKFYTNEKAYDVSMLKDLEEKEFQTAYMDGIVAYEEHRFMDVLDKMERSLEKYMEEYEKCRALCDAPPGVDIRFETDFYSTITSFYIQVLKCRSDCETRQSFIRGNRMDDFVPSLFHYMQFAYWKESMVRSAAEAVATFLLFFPEDETMLHNRRYYLENFDLKIEHFVPRSEVVRYYKRLLLEKRLLAFLTEKFRFDDEDYPRYHPDDYRDIRDDVPGFDDDEYADLEERRQLDQENKSPMTEIADDLNLPPAPAYNRKKEDDIVIPNMEVASPFWTPSVEVLNKYEVKHGVKVVKRENDLSGRYRFLADRLLSKDECLLLMELGKLAELGDGYNGKSSPHTEHEDFLGLTIARVAELAKEGKAPLESAKLLLDKSELGRDLVQTYFNLTTHLYFDYTHLVCRSAKKQTDVTSPTFLRSDLSHSIHGDNCVFKDGRCDKRAPAYTWRDYSAVIYLNDDFAGGEFIFSDVNKDVQAEIKPSCGQMVAFSGDTLHGVKAVTRGSRCVIALWMTLDSSHEELERIRAQQTLAKIEMTNEEGEVSLPQTPVTPHSGEL